MRSISAFVAAVLAGISFLCGSAAHDTAIAPGQTGYFGFLTGGYSASELLWGLVAEGDPSGGEPDLTFEGNAIPEPSTWAMMLLGFAGVGFAGYLQRQKLV
jgi:hypothetical protein